MSAIESCLASFLHWVQLLLAHQERTAVAVRFHRAQVLSAALDKLEESLSAIKNFLATVLHQV